jgi:DNA-binding LytR/AlgR family response regulator
MMLNCVIIDDEPIARKLLQEYIGETDFLQLSGSAENPLKIAGSIRDLEVDLIFLDINMPKMTGLEFLRSAKDLPMVILTTAYDQYALEGFELDVIDYLVKPFSLERFLKACRKAHEFKRLKSGKQSDTAEYFFVKSNGRIEKIMLDELVYVEALTNYITLNTIRGKLITYLTLKGLMEYLPAGRFMQVHKSYVINTGKVKTIEGNTIHLDNAISIVIGQSFREEVIKGILKDKFLKR